MALLVALAALVRPRLANNISTDCIELVKMTLVLFNAFFDCKGGIANVLGVLTDLDEVQDHAGTWDDAVQGSVTSLPEHHVPCCV